MSVFVRVCFSFLFLLLGSVPLMAGDLTVSGARTAPVVTSNADGSGSGDVGVTSSGSITIDANEVAITVDSDNSVDNEGIIYATSDVNETGILVSADTTGSIANDGGIYTGAAGDADSAGTVTDAVIGGPTIQINKSVGGGIKNTGYLTSYGPLNIVIGTDSVSPSDISIGDVGTGINAYGFINEEGTITAYGGNSGDDVMLFRIYSDTGYTTDLGGGLENYGSGASMKAIAYDANAIAISIGDNAYVAEINNFDDDLDDSSATIIGAYSYMSTGGGDAVVIDVDALGVLDLVSNNSLLYAYNENGDYDAIVLRTASASATTIDNSGTLQAQLSDEGTGRAIVIDATAASGDLIISNSGEDALIYAEDSSDSTATDRTYALYATGSASNITINNSDDAEIYGDLYFGDGDDALNVTGGIVTGNLDFGSGTNSVSLSGGSTLEASNELTTGTLDLYVDDATLIVNTNTFEATTATFSSDATLAVSVDDDGVTSGTLYTTGTTTLANGTTIDVNFESYVIDDATVTLVDAGTLDLLGGVSGLDVTSSIIGYDAVLQVVSGSTEQLQLGFSRMTAAELGYTNNLAVVYAAAAQALATDDELGSAVGNVGSEAELKAAYEQLVPDMTGAHEDTAIRLQDITSSQISTRLALFRSNGQSAALKGRGIGYGKTFWAQEYINSDTSDAGANSQSYDGTTVGFTFGFDNRDSNGDIRGFAFTISTHGYDTDYTDAQNSVKSYALSYYRSFNRGPAFIDLVSQIAYNSYEGNRDVVIGDVSRNAEYASNGYQGGLSGQLGYSAALGRFSLQPSLGASYVYLTQGSYDEAGGGDGVDMHVEADAFHSLLTNADLKLQARFGGEQSQLFTYVNMGWSHQLLEATPQSEASFLSTGTSMTLKADEYDKDTLHGGVGFSINNGWSRLGLDYRAQVGDSLLSHQATASATLIF